MPKSRPEPERFWEKVRKTETCWLWTAGTIRGYGQFSLKRRTGQPHVVVYAHRWAYEHEVGPIPEGLHLDHLCRVILCVRPDHLEPVTPGENLFRSENPKIVTMRTGVYQRGHSMNDAYYRPSGSRTCRTCSQEAAVRRRLDPANPMYPSNRRERRAAQYRHTTSEQLVQIRLLRSEGWTYRRIADAVGCSVSAVGIALRKVTKC